MALSIPKFRKSFSVSVISFLSLLLTHCGDRSVTGLAQSVEPSLTRCQSGVAQILVGDGFFEILCGCTSTGEEQGTVFTATSNSLTCHLSAPPVGGQSVVFFYFNGITFKHQIVSTGPVNFGATPLYDPAQGNTMLPSGIVFPQASTNYTFQDALTGLPGQFFVL